MNKNILLLIVFLSLAGGTFWYLNRGQEQQKSTLPDWDRKFKVQNIDDVHKAFIVSRSGEKTTLERKDDYWTYNEKYRALPNAVENLLRAFGEIQMQYKPANKAVPNMVRDLAAHGIKVELYDKSNVQLRAYYIGGGTSSERGTYAIMENSEQPYVVHLPTWDGNLRTRFNLKGDEWRDKTVLRAKVEDIQAVSIEYPKQQNKSFKLEKKGAEYQVVPFYDFTPKSTSTISKGKVEAFLVGLKSVGAEAFETKNPRKDSVVQTIPFCTIKLKKTDGELQEVKLFPIYVDAPNIDPSTGRKLADTFVERYFAEVNEEDFMLVQHRVFEKVFWGYDFFFN